MRVHELAKKLDLTSKDILDFLKKSKIKVGSHMSLLEADQVALVEKQFSKKKSEPAKVAAKPTKEKIVEPVKAKEVAPKKVEIPVIKTTPAVKPHSAKETKAPEKPVVKQQPVAPVKPAPTAPVIDERHFVDEEDEDVETKPAPSKPQAPVKETPVRVVRLRIPITVGDLAAKLNIRAPDLIKQLIGFRVMANVNQLLDKTIVYKVAELQSVLIEEEPSEEQKVVTELSQEKEENLVFRSPVVTLMGHVDHGKTSLLDAIRATNVADREAGRITQHIGAYEVEIPQKGKVTFLDTPGHEAFTAMRARGANITDVVVLVVAADDGIMPQTIEAIDHARAAELPIVVAVNKCDLPAANPDRVKAELQKLDLAPEDWGGKTICVNVSAKTKKGIDKLLEMLLLESELLELKANPNRKAEGTVIEAKVSKGRGTVATILVQKGTLHVGDPVVCGATSGKVRAMHNDLGKTLKDAGPSCPVEILGLEGVPEAGDKFFVVEDEKTARRIAEERQQKIKERTIKGQVARHTKLEDLYSKIKDQNIKELKLIIKADVQGSAEALKQSLAKIGSEKIQLRVIHAAVGGVNESDVMLAAASDAVVIGFNVRTDAGAQKAMDTEGVDVRLYNIIYEAIEDIKAAMEGMLEPTIKEVVVGKARVLQVFTSSKAGSVAGCRVVKGIVSRSSRVRLVRDNIVMFDGKLASLRRFKDDVREVQEGVECGLSLEGHNDLKEGDTLEVYKQEKVATKL